jgi:NTE family protein
MIPKTALVLSGGGMFGAWQAGAWRALAERIQPDLIVGASVGSLNGYAIACGASPRDLSQFWMRPELASLRNLPRTIQSLMQVGSPDIDYALVITDLLRLKPRIIRGREVTWRHLAASCAIPGVLPQYKIGGRWYTDGGILNPLPVWAAVELGASRIVAVHVLPEIPAWWLKPLVKGFRGVFGHHPPVPEVVEVTVLKPPRVLGSMRDALRWDRDNAERWIAEGYAAAKNISILNCLER